MIIFIFGSSLLFSTILTSIFPYTLSQRGMGIQGVCHYHLYTFPGSIRIKLESEKNISFAIIMGKNISLYFSKNEFYPKIFYKNINSMNILLHLDRECEILLWFRSKKLTKIEFNIYVYSKNYKLMYLSIALMIVSAIVYILSKYREKMNYKMSSINLL